MMGRVSTCLKNLRDSWDSSTTCALLRPCWSSLVRIFPDLSTTKNGPLDLWSHQGWIAKNSWRMNSRRTHRTSGANKRTALRQFLVGYFSYSSYWHPVAICGLFLLVTGNFMWLWHPHSTYRVEVLHIQVVSICLDMLGFLLIIHPNKDPPKDDGIASFKEYN